MACLPEPAVMTPHFRRADMSWIVFLCRWALKGFQQGCHTDGVRTAFQTKEGLLVCDGSKMHCYACKAHTFRCLLRRGREDLDQVLGSSERPSESKVPWNACPKMASLVIGNTRHYFGSKSFAWSALEILHHNNLGSSVSPSKISPSQKTFGTERLGLWLFCMSRSQLAPAGLQGPLQLKKEVMKSIYELVSLEAGWATLGWIWRLGYESLFLWSLSRAVHVLMLSIIVATVIFLK